MTLPPLIESSSSERARELLRIARSDRPRSGAAQRTLTALGVVGSAATMAGAALGSAGAQAGGSTALSAVSSLPMLAAKWLVVGTLGGLALASGATLAFSSHPSAPAGHSVQSAAPGRAPAAVATPAASAGPSLLRDDAEPAPLALEPQPAPGKSPKAPSAVTTKADAAAAPVAAPSQAAFDAPEQSKLLHDVALLDDARRALNSGDSAQALALIARYEAERQTHVLDREAEVLRQRAQGGTGQ